MSETINVTLAEISEAPKNEKTYLITLWWLIIGVFLIVYLVFSELCFIFRFSLFFTDNDFLSNWNTPAATGSGANILNNKIYSDKGRLTIFLWSFGLATLCSIISYFILTAQPKSQDTF
jgi:energy-coupling factor transporter transmembrane protein EcfT